MVMRAVAWELNPKDPRCTWWASVHQNVENMMSEQCGAESSEHMDPVQRQANKGVWSGAMTMGNKKETSSPKVWLNIFRKQPEVSLTSHIPPGRHCASQGVALTAAAGRLQLPLPGRALRMPVKWSHLHGNGLRAKHYAKTTAHVWVLACLAGRQKVRHEGELYPLLIKHHGSRHIEPPSSPVLTWNPKPTLYLLIYSPYNYGVSSIDISSN